MAIEPTLDAALSASLRWMSDLADSGGPDFFPTSARKLESERCEFVASPSLEEAADVAICLAAACLHEGWSLDDLATAIQNEPMTGTHVLRKETWDEPPLDAAVRIYLRWIDDLRILGGPDFLPVIALKIKTSRTGFITAPTLAEAAKIMESLAAACADNGWSPTTLAAAIQAKNARNALRTWVRVQDGTYQHEPTGAHV